MDFDPGDGRRLGFFMPVQSASRRVALGHQHLVCRSRLGHRSAAGWSRREVAQPLELTPPRVLPAVAEGRHTAASFSLQFKLPEAASSWQLLPQLIELLVDFVASFYSVA